MDAAAGVTREEGRTGFLHLPSAVIALIFIARRIQSSLMPVMRNPLREMSTVQSLRRILEGGYIRAHGLKAN